MTSNGAVFRQAPRLAALSLLLALPVHSQVTLPSAARVTPVIEKPGFQWRIFANKADTTDSLQRAEDALSGVLTDGSGKALPNLADPDASGPALGRGVAVDPANPALTFFIPGTLNLGKSAGGSVGNFSGDQTMPGLPATNGSSDGVAVEVITYLDLPAGTVTMGVNSDDGFEVHAGIPQDAVSWHRLGGFDGGRGAADTQFTLTVTQAGVYPFRLIYEQGRNDAGLEWFTVATNGVRTLINDTANGGIQAYREITTGTYPYPIISSVTPSTDARQLNQPGITVEWIVTDGTLYPFDPAQATFKIDGRIFTGGKREGNRTRYTTKLGGLQLPLDLHTNSVAMVFPDGSTRTNTWTYRNLKNVILPTAKLTENFDSYDEGTQPTSWTASNFTASCGLSKSLRNDESSVYLNWVVINTNTLPYIDGEDTGAVNPNETLNGSPLTPEALRSNNMLYAESDGRCEGTQRRIVLSNRTGVHGQTQIIISKAFNLSSIENVLLSFGCGFKQNEDSLGGVEYSVDGGTTWLPVVYYIDQDRVILNGDGSVDGVGTFNAVRDDTALWVVSGAVKGERFADFIAATINDSIGQYIAPRINDDGINGKRIEVFRLPSASKKSDVRLRFVATGTDSWYFFVDNINFYEAPERSVTTTPISNFQIALFGESALVSWSGGAGNFVLQEASTPAGPWSDLVTTTTRSVTLPHSESAQFFRVRDVDAIQ